MILEVLDIGGHRDGELHDLDWSMAISNAPHIVARRAAMTTDLVTSRQARSVWELLLQADPTWGEFEEHGEWGIARKLSTKELRTSVEQVVVHSSPQDLVIAVVKRVRLVADSRRRP